MTEPISRHWKSDGLRRLLRAARNQSEGVRQGLLHDPAIRQVSIGCIVLSACALALPLIALEKLLLILSLLLVVAMEYINSAIEAVVDRISQEEDPLSKNAKDFGSVAVGLTVLMASLCWLVIAGPVVLSWLRSFL